MNEPLTLMHLWYAWLWVANGIYIMGVGRRVYHIEWDTEDWLIGIILGPITLISVVAIVITRRHRNGNWP